MATLERVIQMKQQGMSDSQIVGSLRQEGVSPKEISEIISQSNIKLALNQENSFEGGNPDGQTENSMQQSIMGSPGQMAPQMPVDKEGFTDYSANSSPPPQQEEQQPVQEFQGNPEQTYQEYYPEYQQQYQEYQPQQALDIETVNDIAEQLIEEKTEKLEKQISAFTKFREELQFDVEKMNERLTKIEVKFDELQMAIIKKIGEYGRDIGNISKEMHLTQESFSKVLDPLTDNIRALQEITGNKSVQTQSNKVSQTQRNENTQEEISEQPRQPPLKKQKTDFESYLR
ncbi:MAG: hypothetical protein WC979_05130 [Candidatus Pacearchaeota archaeon]|jgi:hypothetical protein